MQPSSPTSPVFSEAASKTETMAQQGTSTLEQLQTPQQVELLDKIDELRHQGLGHHGISLPQLIVCGDQSSGKSSLLEGLTHLRFPTKEGMCTTFATEVVLRREPDIEISCTITPGKSRSPTERRELAKFKRTFPSRESFLFESVTEQAKEQMERGARSSRVSIFEDVLRVRYSGPELPSLTIVDLPGLFETELGGGSGAERVAELVTSYMRDDKSIILAVVVADNDPENQKVFRYLKDFDSTGARTLGIVTKPDKVERGGDNEKEMMRLVKNQKLPLKHRWHAVRNRSYATKDQTPAERDEAERIFFSNGVWASFPSQDVGIAALRVKLSQVLLEHIGRELPELITAVQSSIQTTEVGLKALGPVRDTAEQQRSYLMGHAQRFQTLTNDALRGIYSNPFFALSSLDEPATTRLRTEVQNLNMAFAQTMYVKGHTWNIGSTHGSSAPVPSDNYSQAFLEYNNEFDKPEVISREDLNSHIGELVRQSRPSGLPSLVNPLVIGDLFKQQSQHWCKHAKHHLQRVFKAVTAYVEEALGSLMDPYTCSMLMLKQVRPELDRRWRSVEAKLEELLVPYTEQDPVTYDPSFVYQVEELRAARYASKTKVQAGGPASASVPFVFGAGDDAQNYRQSAEHLLTESIDNYANSEILDLMQTYYKAIFISNIATLGIENCLIKDLSAIFSPTLTAGMDDDKLSAIASESEDIRHERATLKHKLSVLESGKQVLFEHIAMRPTIRTTTKPATTSLRSSMTPSRSRTQNSRQDEQERRDATPDAEDELSRQLDNLVVTPPSPASALVRSRPRVDSGTGTPTPKKQGRRRSPFGWPPKYDVPRATVEDASDDD
ncbi:interferon-induced gtp-binding protein mx [Pyrenophora tritici-repentis]|uniref:Dynamin family protein n=2 Tax=Pyrenophora tritici-repentis TaxID=45151 RepID=A0A2W1F8H7_9PLEO|nr:dynamin-1 [Pyrenophora tritici-repentis Pt-1C-BFP]KAA8616844.1 interferon-induced gtp-binding protein mx [Pyrenophora tritici-repentis]EDU50737.1 dynamin-1 [Pyrenophora tritici-repentis Pt-1C-BFP]KAF7446137.1 interferon-induced gtp-binding protein mx [Pyrenophora tritici-repentis]KAF7567242.1 Dynamin family protein [Pyrenophora tritici-repentis]KAG9381842.1 interferon-induced gtp-binding protein mx [Pyrenophora tritici-repentis]